MQVASQTTLQESPTADETAVSRQSLLGLNLEEVEEIVTSQGLPRFRARQLWRRVWRHGLGRLVGQGHEPLHANTGMSEPRGRLAQCSVSLHAVLAASLGAHRKAQHARVCFAGGRYFSRQRQLRECRCSARSAKRLAESTLGNCMLGNPGRG